MDNSDYVSYKLRKLGLDILEFGKPDKGKAGGFVKYKYGPFIYMIDWDVAIYLKDVKNIVKNSHVQSGRHHNIV